MAPPQNDPPPAPDLLNISTSSYDPHSAIYNRPPQTRGSRNPNTCYSSVKDIPSGYEEIRDEENEDTIRGHLQSIRGSERICSYGSLNVTATRSSQNESPESLIQDISSHTSNFLNGENGSKANLPRQSPVASPRSQIYSFYKSRSNNNLSIQNPGKPKPSTTLHEGEKVMINDGKFVRESCRKTLKLKPQITVPRYGCDNLETEGRFKNLIPTSGFLPKIEHKNYYNDKYDYTEQKQDEKSPFFPGTDGLDSDASSEYGSDSGLFELFPVLDMLQSSQIYPRNSVPIVDGHGKMIEEEYFGDIGDDEMLEAINDLEKHAAAACAEDKWDGDSDIDDASIFDDYPTMEAPDEKTRGEKFFHLQSPPVTPHRSIQESLSTDHGIIQSQNLSLTPRAKLRESDTCPSDEILMNSEPFDVIEQFSAPSDIPFARNNFSQGKEILGPSLQRSSPPEHPVEASEHLQGIPSNIYLSDIEIEKFYEFSDELDDINNAEELVSGPETFSYTKANKEISDGAIEPELREDNKEKGKNDEHYTDVDLIKIGNDAEGNDYDCGGENENGDNNNALPMNKKRKFKGKNVPAKVVRCREIPKKRRIRVVDPSQLQISNYISFHKQPPARPRYDEKGNISSSARLPSLPMVPEDRLVPGISAGLSVKTCFHIGEALRVGENGALTGDALIELYARVGFSERVDLQQNFEFVDIFHENPPFLTGFFQLAVEYRVWEEASAVFLGDTGKGRMARVVGRMQRRIRSEGATTAFILKISTISEINWDSVELKRAVIYGAG